MKGKPAIMQGMMLDLLTLKLFVRVLEEGTISKAAEREHIASAAVSRRLAELEHQLGATLLIRNNKGISPTAAGMELLYRARTLLNSVQDIQTRIQAYSEGQHGKVHILANPSAITQFLAEPLAAFAQQSPRVQLRIEEATSLDIIQALAEGKADIGVFTRLPYQADIEVFPFRHDQLVVLVPAGHALASRTSVNFVETLAYPHITLTSGTHINYQLSKIATEHNLPLDVRAEVSGYDAMCLLVKAGLGLGILPRESACLYHLPGTRTLALNDTWRERELLVGVRRRNDLQPSAASVLGYLLSDNAD